MIFQISRIRTVAAAFLLLLTTSASHAVVMDWTQAYASTAWTQGAASSTTTNSYNNDAANTGNDITIAIASSAGVTWNAGYPKNVQANGTTVVGSDDASRLQMFVSTMTASANTISVTITFNYAAGVTNVSFPILDIDASGTGNRYTDRIATINATPVVGSPNSVALTAVNVSNAVTTVAGSGTLGMSVTGVTSGGNIADHTGDVTFSTGATAIKSITFTWNNPGGNGFQQQIIALGNITYTPVPVPEIGSSLGALALCGGLAGVGRFRQRRPPGAAACV
ncbi:MAG: hypothetical protein ABIP20_02520 [Chthoniobacteraceae bacterium]